MIPTELAKQIEERYRSYLQTTFYFRDPDLRQSFNQVLSQQYLAKGPYLEATPVFKRRLPPRILFQELLEFQPDNGFLEATEGDRPLYEHQERAIRDAFHGQNVIVATGTASGKTEAFLYPILLHLYQQFRTQELGSGVRALVLYPMNALANDQRERLGKICEALEKAGSQFRFTFGQYIGETPEDENDSRRHANDHWMRRFESGELVFRSQMRKDPPHILLTNYSMLEYLLLRPDDSLLFDKGRARHWTFLILDEAHQYRGSKGIEMAMLIRRLKQRLRQGGRTGPFRCIATSATLVGGEGDKAAVARFASNLLGEEFKQENVILGDTEPIPEAGQASLLAEDYADLASLLNGSSAIAQEFVAAASARLGLPASLERDLPTTAGRLLGHDKRTTDLRQRLANGPLEVRELADDLFPDLDNEERVPKLAQLVELLLHAKDPASGSPLLSARYHLFLRSLEGAFLSYWPEKRVFLERKAAGQEGAAFEVALCKECGQHYFVGRKGLKNGKVTEPVRDPSDESFGATFLRPVEDGWEEDEEGEDGSKSKVEVHRLCVQCGVLAKGDPLCGHGRSIRVVREEAPEAEDRADQVKRCGACGYNAAGRDPVREVVHGTDGPHAVIATTIYQNLPEARRKVLAFADSRQEAAFFAWYLGDSYKSLRNRSLILQGVQRLSTGTPVGLALGELAIDLRQLFRETKTFPASMGELELFHEAWLALYREFLSDEPRISLEGTGLIQWTIRWPDWFEIPPVLKASPWSLTDEEAKNVVLALLDSMRTDKSVELRTKNDLPMTWAELGLQARQTRTRIGLPKGQWDVRSWDGQSKGNRRAKFLAKVLMKGGFQAEGAIERSRQTLKQIWESATESDKQAPSSSDRLLLSVDDARRLNPAWWRAASIPEEGQVFQCDVCGRVRAVSIRGICARHRCTGTLMTRRRKELDPNHYRTLYESKLVTSLRVEEHTAQLDKEKAREFQREFREGKIHVLSSSTTFELGVDLGDLDIIFLRNVPPEAFNYAQRVGRAGRHADHPGFAITYCRRSPHDLYHFFEPKRMLRGKTQPPVLSLQNDKIVTRHAVATALSAFFGNFRERFSSVEGLFKDLTNPTAVSDFRDFLERHREEVEADLKAIVPDELHGRVGLGDRSWLSRLTDDSSRFSQAEKVISKDYLEVIQLKKRAAEAEDGHTMEWAKARAKTIADEDVLSFLSRNAVIPKYGFPVDVVELDTQRTQKSQESSEVCLQRDLSIAISEFAPESKLIANKKEWASYGLKRVAAKEWERKEYKICRKHNVFVRWGPGEPEPTVPCGDILHSKKYIIPNFGFVTNRDKPKEPIGRNFRALTTRPYFAGHAGPEPAAITLPSDPGIVVVKKASPGWMAVLCEGRRERGFYVCQACGAGSRSRRQPHKTPFGENCSATLPPQVSLGHEFVTDVLQLQFLRPADSTDPVWFAYSLAYALLEGVADVLEVPSTDLNATVASSSAGQPLPPIVLYDNVPGGAGLVARLEEPAVFKAALEAAKDRVDGRCGCKETSCYGCLRSYRNQFAHSRLAREPVKAYLEAILSGWI